jgi:hypothetical protein
MTLTRSRFPSPARVWLPAALAGLLAGCGGPSSVSGTVYPVSGQVLLPDGKPMQGGQVQFLPKGESGASANGEVGSDGKFTLKTADGRDGAPTGEYKVRVLPGPKYVNKKIGRVDPATLPFDAKYTDEDGNTDLTATVKAEPTTLEPFKLERARAAGSKRSND